MNLGNEQLILSNLIIDNQSEDTYKIILKLDIDDVPIFNIPSYEKEYLYRIYFYAKYICCDIPHLQVSYYYDNTNTFYLVFSKQIGTVLPNYEDIQLLYYGLLDPKFTYNHSVKSTPTSEEMLYSAKLVEEIDIELKSQLLDQCVKYFKYVGDIDRNNIIDEIGPYIMYYNKENDEINTLKYIIMYNEDTDDLEKYPFELRCLTWKIRNYSKGDKNTLINYPLEISNIDNSEATKEQLYNDYISDKPSESIKQGNDEALDNIVIDPMLDNIKDVMINPESPMGQVDPVPEELLEPLNMTPDEHLEPVLDNIKDVMFEPETLIEPMENHIKNVTIKPEKKLFNDDELIEDVPELKEIKIDQNNTFYKSMNENYDNIKDNISRNTDELTNLLDEVKKDMGY